MRSREEVIKNYIKPNIQILDVGSTGQTKEYSLWNFFKSQGVRVIGIDTVPSEDPDIVMGDMESHDFGKQFDLIIAGDVLEHVKNQGMFLENIHKHLKDGGKFVMTTPNAKWLTVFFRPNPTHTLWHDKYTLRYILKLAGFDVEFFSYYFGNKKHYNFFLRPLVWRQGMIVVCKKHYG